MGDSTPGASSREPQGWRALTVSGAVDGPGTVPLRPMTVGDLLDEPFILLRAHLRSFILFAAIAVVPSQLLQNYLSRGMFGLFDVGLLAEDPERFSAALAGDPGAGGAGIVVSVANAAILLPLAYALVSRLAVSSVLGERVRDAAVMRAAARRLPALAGTSLLALSAIGVLPGLGGLLVATGSPALGASVLLVGVPVALALTVLLAPAPLIAVAERRGPVASLRRSAALMSGRFWAAAGVLSLALIVSSLVQTAIGIIPTGLAFAVPEQWSWVLAAAGSTMAGLISTPYVMLVVVLLYFDARVRREALDVEILSSPSSRGTRAAG